MSSLQEYVASNGHVPGSGLACVEFLKTCPLKDRIWPKYSPLGSQLAWGLEEARDPEVQTRLAEILNFQWAFRSQRAVPAIWAGKSQAELSEIFRRLLGRLSSPEADVMAGLELLAIAQALPDLSHLLEPVVWDDVWNRLVATCDEAHAWHTASDLRAAHLYMAELPITLAAVYHTSDAAKRVGKAGVDFLDESLNNLQQDGVPVGIAWDDLTFLLASWTRCMAMLDDSDVLRIRKRARRAWGQLLEFLFRALRPDGSISLGPSLDSAQRSIRQEMLRAAAKLARRGNLTRLWKLQIGRRKKCSGLSKLTLKTVEDGGVCVSRSAWTADAMRLAIDYGGPTMRIELANSGRSLLQGPIETVIRVDDSPLMAGQRWRSIFTYSDNDVDVAEFELDAGSGWKVVRQFVVAREDQFLYAADLLHGGGRSTLSMETVWPVAEPLTVGTSNDTRECWLACHRRNHCRVLPLLAPEWRVAPGILDISPSPDHLAARARTTGCCLYLPLFIDCHPRRCRRPATWRVLTVAEALRKSTLDEAVAFRVQSGIEQWVFYRSFTRTGNRTFLGQNVANEFYCGRFLADGTSESLIEIENTS